jgi:outer membrane lipopolysaccharide assembly protein LptE/RlpB
MKKIISHILVLSLLFITSCGFRVLNQNELNNFNIIKIETSGDKRINFKIKNNLATQAQRNSNNNIEIRISTQKNKNIKEKNIKNEITKYNIHLNSLGEFNFANQNKKMKFNVKVSGYYLVANNYSTTLANEKSLINSLIEDLSKKILNEINLILNDS